MKKLFKLKEWLTITETAKHLSGLLSDDVTEPDVLRLALDGHLKLAVNFVNGALVNGGRRVPLSEAKTVPSLDGERNLIIGTWLPTNEMLELNEGVIGIAGVWDLPLYFGAALNIESRYQELTGGPEVTGVDLAGVFVTNGYSGDWFRLLTDYADTETHKWMAEGKKPYDPKRYFPAGALPEDAVIVVRTEALQEFEQSISGSNHARVKHQSTTAVRDDSLLAVIAALLSNYPKDKEPSGKDLERAAQAIGLKISDDTIRKALKAAHDLAPGLLPK